MNLKTIKAIIQRILKNIKAIIKERWIYHLFGYLFGYTLQLLLYGIHGWQSLFPIKMLAIGSAIVLGNVCYHMPEKLILIEVQGKALKYTIIMLGVFLIIGLLRTIILDVLGFDIAPLI